MFIRDHAFHDLKGLLMFGYKQEQAALLEHVISTTAPGKYFLRYNALKLLSCDNIAY